MKVVRQMTAQLGNALEWSSAAKGTMLLVVTLIMHGEYALWLHYILSRPDREQLVNVDFLIQETGTFNGLFLISLFLCILIPLIHKRLGDSRLYEHVAANYFGLSHIYYAWLIGSLSLPAGVVLAGAPVLGFIFFNQAAVIGAFCSSSLTLATISLLSASGSLSYAPAVPVLNESAGAISWFWTSSYLMFSVPHIAVLFGLAYLVLRRWREREEEVRVMSRIDPLTGLFNRRSILTHLRREQDRSMQQGLPLAVVMLDLDHFKQINDTWGHESGDYVLIAAADALQKAVRQNDRVGRYGGEEFLLVLPGSDTEGARRLAERCRQQIEALEVMLNDGRRIRVSASMGLYCNEKNRQIDVDSLLRIADKALYAAKESGRNRVVVAEDPFVR